MPLQKQLLHVPFAGGPDTKTDPKQVVPGKLALLYNGTFKKPKEIGKRPGTDALSRARFDTGLDLSVGQGLVPYRDELLAFTGTEMLSFSEANDAWVPKGNVISAHVTKQSVVRTAGSQTHSSVAKLASGAACYAYKDSVLGICYTVVDHNVDLDIAGPIPLDATGTKPNVCAVGSVMFAVTWVDASHNLKVAFIPAGAPASSAGIHSLATLPAPTADNYDAIGVGSQLLWVANAVSKVTIGYINPQGLQASADVSTHNGDDAIGITATADGSGAVVAYGSSAHVIRWFAFRGADLTLTQAVTTVGSATAKDLGLCQATDGTTTVYATIAGSPSTNDLIHAYVVTGTPSDADLMRSVSLAGKPVFFQGQTYLTVAYTSQVQPTYFLIDGAANVHARMIPGNCGWATGAGPLPNVATHSDHLLIAVAERAQAFSDASGVLFFLSGTSSIEVQPFSAQRSYSAVELAGVLHVSGGFLGMYDGESFVEHGFHYFPEEPTGVTSSGGSVDDGDHGYCVVYEWVDATGARHQSAPSLITTVTVSSTNQTVTLTIPTLRVTAKAPVNAAGVALAYPRANVSIAVYRTVANATEFFRISSLTSPLYNDVTADSVSYVDTAADASIVGGQPLYTFGGVVEDVAAPACSGLTVHKNRLVLISTETPLQLWYSKQVVPGQPVEMSDLFTINVDPAGGDEVTELESMDANLIVAKESTLSYISGDGPADTGASNDFSTPQTITTDVGVSEPRSVVRMPLGLMFKSTKGIYLLGRDLAVAYVGADVEGFNGDAVISATLVRNTNQVRFGLDAGSALVFDYFMQQWSVFTYRNLVDACLWQGSYAFIQDNGRVLVENASVFTDAGLTYQLKATTSWLAVAGVSGLQRVYSIMLLGDYKSPHSLRFSVAYDFNSSPTQVKTVDASGLNPGVWGGSTTWGSDSPWGGNFPTYQWRLDLNRQKCTAVQLTFEDVQTSDFGEGMTLSNLCLWAGVIGTMKQVPASQIVGGADA